METDLLNYWWTNFLSFFCHHLARSPGHPAHCTMHNTPFSVAGMLSPASSCKQPFKMSVSKNSQQSPPLQRWDDRHIGRLSSSAIGTDCIAVPLVPCPQESWSCQNNENQKGRLRMIRESLLLPSKTYPTPSVSDSAPSALDLCWNQWWMFLMHLESKPASALVYLREPQHCQPSSSWLRCICLGHLSLQCWQGTE